VTPKKMKVLLSVHQFPKWREYLNSRLAEYRRVVCAANGTGIEIASAQLVLPAECDAQRALDHKLGSRIFPRSPNGRKGWARRDDAYVFGAEQLIEESRCSGRSWLFCHDEYAKPADVVLRKRRHFVSGSQVFLLADLNRVNAEEAARTMRQARSRRTIAVLSDEERGPCELGEGGIFCTDVFDGDALVICLL
jgi:hypothetical protein